MVVQEPTGCPWGKCLDDPQHLENSMEIYLQERKIEPYVIISKTWVKS